MAAILAEGHQQIVDVYPEVLGQRFRESPFRLLGILCAHQTEAVGDAVDVGVDADGRDAETESENKVGGLAPDPGQGE